MEMAQKTLYRMNTVDDSEEYWTATDNELEAFAALVREDALAQPAPVQEPVAWNKPTDAMVEAATNEYDEWSKDNQGTTECIRAMLVKAMKATPPAQPAPYMAVLNDRINIDPHTGNVSIGTVAQPKENT
jgi:hypothetical protein